MMVYVGCIPGNMQSQRQILLKEFRNKRKIDNTGLHLYINSGINTIISSIIFDKVLVPW